MLPFLNLSTAKWLTMGCVTFLEICRWARRLPPDKTGVVFLYNLSLPPALFSLAAARLAGAKTLAFVADLYAPGEIAPATLRRRVDFILQKTIIGRVDGLILMSQRRARDRASDGRLIVVDCAIADRVLSDFERRPRTAGGNGRGLVFGFAGALEPHNGVREAIAAFQRLRDANLRLWVAGRGSLAGEAKVAADADQRIDFLGALAQDEVFARYSSTDVLLNCRSTRTGFLEYAFPSKLAELLASGAVVITTDIGDLRDELRGKALIAHDSSTEALESAMRAVLSMAPADREAMGLAARDWIRATRSWTVQSGRILDYVSEQVLNGRRACTA